MIPSYLHEEIYKENKAEMHEKQTANTEYYNLIENLLTLPLEAGCSARIELCKVGITFVLTTLLKVKDASILTTWINRMKTIVSNEKEVARWLLELLMSNESVLSLILEQNQPNIATMSSLLVACCLNVAHRKLEKICDAFFQFLMGNLFTAKIIA